MKYRNLLTKAVAVISIFTLLLSCFSACTQNKQREKTYFALSDAVTLKIISDDTEKTEEIFSQAASMLQECEMSLSSTNENSELYKLNTEKKVYASEFLEKIISDSVLMSDILGKSVDISIGEITSLWGFSTDSPSVPNKVDIQNALSAMGTDKIVFSEENKKISLPADVSVDLGAVDKGAVCDRIYESIKLYSEPFIMTFGGSVLAYGTGPSGGEWKIGLKNPVKGDSSEFATLTLSPDSDLNTACLSTSSVADKSFTQDGVKYHHILSPATGYPVETELVSVTVTASTAFIADILSTACFIAGLSEEAMKFLSYFSAEAIFVFSDSTCFVTEGLRDSINITDRSFSLTDYDY